jgi:hypothetical protein
MFINPLSILESKKRQTASIRAKKPRYLREIEGHRRIVFSRPRDFPTKTPCEPEGSIRKCRKNKVATKRSLESRQMGKPNYPCRAISEYPPSACSIGKRETWKYRNLWDKKPNSDPRRRAIANENCSQ